ncbi:NADH-quinone oxidoreductase subunit NuoF [Sphaerochaeta halotolerans]|jgi:NADH:ubiquinone oxidoreductase subunit F (NADH-binding)/(2Fe-2S) ferredoxin/NAD-dependent dihydropyrimidine dehydrogenase PreA subunit|uniref:NADH-quinone oxidoreductase subunit NuoF n=1 Tax=Sphaerochaeta halotolerans TaxID=2293840 RepID=A0A372MIW0_9SPIR|nr:NADH-quinone oxidoreductase subunit NuoF [Sphaerochaeta halotolerans]MBG0766486.1 NADH-quinone oxidoreductase subunit NuoF [Spirochaetaceae bacterium]MXI86166.1 NADH-quinone oxidoreductase subunit J/K [Sphaerochaeta halotolerans]RFU95737.1 NADH-quinone oxidoreductase subunit NuoF [Sphaerochaeta halotolerans]
MAFRNYILVCGGTACESSRADQIYQNLLEECKAQGVADEVQIVKTGCFGFCEQGPIVKILPEDSFYVKVKPEDAKELISEHIIKGREVTRLLYDKEASRKNAKVEDIKFYQKQFRIVLRNCGFIDPENIDEYIAREGYQGLEKALFEMTSEDIIEELKTAGLRGRGGAGFPTWMKWNFSRQAEDDVKYVVCNADEGDPGAYMDRSTLEGDPHSVLEAMTICGKAIGATRGFIYIRAEYPLAIHRLEIAMQQAREYGLLGDNILGSGFDFDIEIRLGAGAFVCGEETALLQSIEGKRGMPQPRPPFPAVKGLWGKPTVINNVETWANIPVILTKGGNWFSKIGTPDSRGTKVFALTGKIRNSGLVEVPMGTTLREIVYDIGGGIANDKKFKAVQTGGPSGGVITDADLDTPIDFGSLVRIGSMMGSGGMIVMDEDDCIVDVAKFYLNFTVDESCGKCAPCRIGGRSLTNILEKITSGNGTLQDLDTLETIGEAMRKGSLCALGQTAPNPVLSTVKHFKDEYIAHIVDKNCPSGTCKKLVRYSINPEKCNGCTACARKCPVAAISGGKKQVHIIDQSICSKCGVCMETCKFGAVEIH